ncbi:TPA_asm: P5 [Kobresia betacytorhabdovirus 1]|nr:TPA_asm: P5 [Kobresia betacytorhabdovirus 1]
MADHPTKLIAFFYDLLKNTNQVPEKHIENSPQDVTGTTPTTNIVNLFCFLIVIKLVIVIGIAIFKRRLRRALGRVKNLGPSLKKNWVMH